MGVTPKPFSRQSLKPVRVTVKRANADLCCDAGREEVLRALSYCTACVVKPQTPGRMRLAGYAALFSSLWLHSRAQQRLGAHLYSWRGAACTSSNVLSLLRRKTDTPWGWEGGGGGAFFASPFLVILLPLVDPDANLSVCACVTRAGARALRSAGN